MPKKWPELKLLNEERKDMTQAGMEQAFEQVDAELADDDVLVVYLPDCHESLAGIIAGRVREAYNKPSFVLTRGEDCVKGSGRSIESYHMYPGPLCGVQDLLLKFGGHPMAAGFSLKEENIDEFRRRLNEQSQLTKEDFIPKIWIDVAMPLEYISEALVNELKGLEPFGQNESLSLPRRISASEACVPSDETTMRSGMTVVTEQGRPMEAMVFTVADQFVEEAKQSRSIDVIYYPDINEYNGNRTLQIVVRAYKLHS